MRGDSVESLCQQFSRTVGVGPVEAGKYVEALDEVFKGCGSGMPQEVLDEVIVRSYQDHQESREHLRNLIFEDVRRALDIFEKATSSTVNVLVGLFKNGDDTDVLWRELKHRVSCGEDRHVSYLLSVILQLLIKFEYPFDKVAFLVRDLGIRMKEPEIKPLALILFVRLESVYKDQFEKQFLDFIDSMIVEAEFDIGLDPLFIIVDILAELYPALTALCSAVFLGRKLDDLLRERVLQNTNDVVFCKSLLSMLSAGCIDENVRNHIANSYVSILEETLKLNDYKVYAALVLIKTWSFTKLHNVTVNDLATILTTAITDTVGESQDEESLGLCLEGLAYLTLKTSVKLEIRQNTKFCNALAELIKKNESSSMEYGCLVVFANLSVFSKDSSGNGSFEPKSLRDLKAYSDLKNPNSENGNGTQDNLNDNKEDVKGFIRAFMLDNELLSSIKVQVNKNFSLGSKQQFIRILYNVTREKEFLSVCIKQGCMATVLEYLSVKNDPQNDFVRILALRTLTKMLIHTNPNIIFTKYSALNAIPFLFELLPQVSENTANNNSERDVFHEDLLTVTDSYEALLSLTNLASPEGTSGEDVCKKIVNTEIYWKAIENMMLDDNVLLQRSDLELLSNMMIHPMTIAAKFFNFENQHSKKNFNLLVKLLQLNDIQSQRAVAALLANAVSSLPMIASELVTQEELIDNAVEVLKLQLDDTELRQRLIILFYSIIQSVPKEDQNKIKGIASNKEFVSTLKSAKEMENSNNDFTQAIDELLVSIA